MTPFAATINFASDALMRITYVVITTLLISLTLSVPTQAQEKPEIMYAQVGEVKLAYYLKGQGEPMILINGYSATMSVWDPALLDELATKNQLIIFDNRGVGLSTDTKENHTTIPQMADDAAGLAKTLGFKKVNVLAWSMGARIGQQFVIRHPEITNKVILCAANPGGKYQIRIDKSVGEKLNDPNLSAMENVELLFPTTPAGKAAAKDVVARFKAAIASGAIPNNLKYQKKLRLVKIALAQFCGMLITKISRI